MYNKYNNRLMINWNYSYKFDFPKNEGTIEQNNSSSRRIISYSVAPPVTRDTLCKSTQFQIEDRSDAKSHLRESNNNLRTLRLHFVYYLLHVLSALRFTRWAWFEREKEKEEEREREGEKGFIGRFHRQDYRSRHDWRNCREKWNDTTRFVRRDWPFRWRIDLSQPAVLMIYEESLVRTRFRAKIWSISRRWSRSGRHNIKRDQLELEGLEILPTNWRNSR